MANSWQNVAIAETADKNISWSFTGGPFGSNLKQDAYTQDGIRIIQLQNIGDGAFLDNYKIYTSPEKADELKSCNIFPGDIILSKMGDPVARACIIPSDNERYLMASDGIRLAVDKKRFNPLFVLNAINSKYFRIRAEQVSTGSTRRRIGLDVLRKLKIKAPSIDEQDRIVAVLETWDKAIETLKQKIKTKKEIKHGLMQQLLSGTLRLSGFSETWIKIKLKDMGEINPASASLPSEFIYIDLESVEKGRIINENKILLSDAPSRAQRLVKKGDILFQVVRPYQGNNLLFKKDGNYVASTGYAQIRSKISTEYLYHCLHTETFVSNVVSRCTGSNYPAINSTDLGEIEITIPSSESEQNAIANILTTSDQEIDELTNKLQLFEDQKKYLLNNLITGTIRTPEKLILQSK